MDAEQIPSTPATRRCGIDWPVFQAGMAGLAGPELVAAVSNAGGLGHLGGLRVPPSMLRRWIRETKAATDRPFGVNLVPQYGGPEVFDALLDVVIEERPAVLSLFYGEFGAVLPKARAAGLITMVQVGSVSEARRAVSEGADILIAQGMDGGGHLRGRVGLMALLPAVVDVAQGLPVLAAGAISDPRAAAAARCLGADGIWCGTAFLAAEESAANDAYKQILLEAGTDDTAFRTGYSYGWRFGTPHRVIPARRGGLLGLMGGGLRRQDDPKLARKISLYAGQGVGQITRVEPARKIVQRLGRGFAGGGAAGDGA